MSWTLAPSLSLRGLQVKNQAIALARQGGQVYGKSDATGSTPLEDPVHPRDILATVYHTLGINPKTEVFNHLDQPRELVNGEPVLGLF